MYIATVVAPGYRYLYTEVAFTRQVSIIAAINRCGNRGRFAVQNRIATQGVAKPYRRLLLGTGCRKEVPFSLGVDPGRNRPTAPSREIVIA